ncbi:MAG: hypothetical protein M3Q52_03945 [Pseudomonadota bacterium]|nr:hypothetical protein [Pseudomonadota bacterium]
MDGYRDHPSEFDSTAGEEAAASDVRLTIGSDERRMHVRAYNYWVSLLDGRDFPSIEDLEPADLSDFAPNSLLLDFTSGGDDPATAYIGAAIRTECGLADDIGAISQVPSRSLLSRLTDHYLQIVANRAPVGFEAEFENQRGEPICYRGILMPFSSDEDTIDFIYGVISWKRAEAVPAQQPLAALLPPLAAEPVPEPEELEREPTDMDAGTILLPDPEHANIPEEALELPPEPDADASLADQLWAARETAEAVKSADHRSRFALYRALALAYDFALAADEDSDTYAELLEDSGMRAQARAPMTPIVKLVFGIDYDKARLTEFAAALSYARRQQLGRGSFLPFVEGQPGGLKALVAAERQARRPNRTVDDKGEAARARLRTAPALDLQSVGGEEEFTLVIARSTAHGVEAVAVVADEALIERAIRRAAG